MVRGLHNGRWCDDVFGIFDWLFDHDNGWWRRRLLTGCDDDGAGIECVSGGIDIAGNGAATAIDGRYFLFT